MKFNSLLIWYKIPGPTKQIYTDGRKKTPLIKASYSKFLIRQAQTAENTQNVQH